MFDSAQCASCSTVLPSVAPSSVRAYSTVGGTVGCTWRSTRPSRSSFFRVCDSTFCETGDIPSTLPPGRAQGVEGPLKASRAFRAAVPDLRCEVLQMIVAGDRVTAALRFTGHFTGTLGEHQGQGQAIDFIAMDIYRIADGRIAEDWHLEENLAFMRQAGLVGR